MNTLISKNIENPFRLLDEIFNINRDQTKNSFISEHHRGNMPRANIIENEKQFIIEMAIPGMEKDDLSIKINQNILSIQSNKEADQRQYTHFEYSFDTFVRKFQLPNEVKSENITAECKNGILMVYIPKKEEEIIKNKEIKIS